MLLEFLTAVMLTSRVSRARYITNSLRRHLRGFDLGACGVPRQPVCGGEPAGDNRRGEEGDRGPRMRHLALRSTFPAGVAERRPSEVTERPRRWNSGAIPPSAETTGPIAPVARAGSGSSPVRIPLPYPNGVGFTRTKRKDRQCWWVPTRILRFPHRSASPRPCCPSAFSRSSSRFPSNIAGPEHGQALISHDDQSFCRRPLQLFEEEVPAAPCGWQSATG